MKRKEREKLKEWLNSVGVPEEISEILLKETEKLEKENPEILKDRDKFIKYFLGEDEDEDIDEDVDRTLYDVKSPAIIIGHATIEGKSRQFRVLNINVSDDKKKLIIIGRLMKKNHLLDESITKKNSREAVYCEVEITDFNEAMKSVEEMTKNKYHFWDLDKGKGLGFSSAQEMYHWLKEVEKTKQYIV